LVEDQTTFLITSELNHESTLLRKAAARQARMNTNSKCSGEHRPLAWDVDLPLRAASTYRLFDTFARESYVSSMSIPSKFVSLHPYFKVQPGKLDPMKAALTGFVEKTASEKGNLFYGFTINGDEVFCREGYENAEGILAHLDNVGALLKEMLTVADLIRVEVHGPAEEVEKLKGPPAHLNPAWFTLEVNLSH
jgi:quinol monooxygenase YgiN